MEADPAKVAAITQMPTPENKEDVRRLIGMVNYLFRYCPNLSSVAASLRDLTKREVAWSWNANHSTAWESVKQIIKENTQLKLFDPDKPVVVTVDASE